MALVLAVVVVAWQQLWHQAAFGFHDNQSSGWWHLTRDMTLAFPAALLAVVVGLRLADRRAGHDVSVGLLLRSLTIAAVFVALLVPMVAAHALIDDALEQPSSALEGAPGTAYLGSNGLEDDRTFGGLLRHGLRDAAVGAPIAFLATALMVLATTRRPAEPAPARANQATPAAPARAKSAERTATLTKRDVLRLAGGAVAAAALSSSGLVVLATRRAHAAPPGEVTPWLTDRIELFVRDGIYETIEGRPVFMYGWGYAAGGIDQRDAFLTPGPVLWSHEGETIELSITNTRTSTHSFVIAGVVDSGPIEPGETVELTFAAPAPGTYMYTDETNGPVNRVLGLHGVMVVMPSDGSMRSHLDLDVAYWEFSTQWVWVFNQIDPAWNDRAQAGLSIDPGAFVSGFLPRYFTINGQMGSLAAHEETAPDTVISDTLGNPALVRIANAGLATHGPHFHGNHVYPLVINGSVPPVIMWKDTLMVQPGDRIDAHIPFNIPPNAVYFPPPPEGDAFLEELHGRPMEGTWPMHCHVEMSQTAAGGLYPQGLLTDWKLKP